MAKKKSAKKSSKLNTADMNWLKKAGPDLLGVVRCNDRKQKALAKWRKLPVEKRNQILNDLVEACVDQMLPLIRKTANKYGVYIWVQKPRLSYCKTVTNGEPVELK